MSKCLVTTIAYGATWTHFYVPTSDSTVQDILLSFPDDKLYESHPHPYFGNTIGRVANRIANGRLLDLNGKNYELSINESTDGFRNTLHGGTRGWSNQVWSGPLETVRGVWDQDIKNLDGNTEKKGILYTLVNQDGDQGFPGTVQVQTFYFEGRGSKGEVVLEIEYEARLIDETAEATVISMTNHAYFNLNGPISNVGSREDEWNLASHTASLSTSKSLVLESGGSGIPTGSIDHHPSVPRESHVSFSLTGDDGKTRAIDDCFVLPEYFENQASIAIDTRSQPLQDLATLKGDKTGIVLKIQSTEPAFQFYTGKFTDVGPYPGGQGYGTFSGFCVEPSRFVNAAGKQDWRSQVLLRKGETFGARNKYWAWKE